MRTQGVVTLLLAIAASAQGWVAVDGTSEVAYGTAVAVDAADDVYVSGRRGPVFAPHFTVAKLHGDSGFEVWRRELAAEPTPCGIARRVLVTGGGDVVAAGGLEGDCATAQQFAIVALAGDSGDERWRVTDGATKNAYDLALTATHAIAAGGSLIVAVDLEHGTAAWRHEDLDVSYIAIGVDGDGNVVAAGTASDSGGLVTALAFDGGSRWTTSFADGPVVSLAVATDGGVAAGIPVGAGLLIVALDAGGHERWRTFLPNFAQTGRSMRQMVFLDGGDLAVGGHAEILTGEDTLAGASTVRLAGNNGQVVWQQILPDGGAVHALAAIGGGVAGVGEQFAAFASDGALVWQRPFSALGVSLAADGADDLIATGETGAGSAISAFVTVKVGGQTGVPFGCGDGDLDAGEACDVADPNPPAPCLDDCSLAGTTSTTTTTLDGATTTSTTPEPSCALAGCDDGDFCTLDICRDDVCDHSTRLGTRQSVCKVRALIESRQTTVPQIGEHYQGRPTRARAAARRLGILLTSLRRLVDHLDAASGSRAEKYVRLVGLRIAKYDRLARALLQGKVDAATYEAVVFPSDWRS